MSRIRRGARCRREYLKDERVGSVSDRGGRFDLLVLDARPLNAESALFWQPKKHRLLTQYGGLLQAASELLTSESQCSDLTFGASW